MKSNKKLIALICVVLLMVGAAGATLAWLTDQTQTITNTFTSSDINITLEESGATDSDDNDLLVDSNSYQMIPGSMIAKAPKVTVLGGSEACWLFVEVTKSTDKPFDDYMTYGVRTDIWKSVPGTDNVYYCKVDKSANDQPFYILTAGEEGTAYADGYVTVKGEVTKAMMEAIDGIDAEGNVANDELAKQPTLTFKAYAVQQANITDVADAWQAAQDLATN